MSIYTASRSEPLSEAHVRALDARVQPNVYAVVHLKPFLVDYERETKIEGDKPIYEGVAYEIMRDLSRELKGRRAYDRSPRHLKRLPSIVTLEGLGTLFPHLNFCINRPHWVSFHRLRSLLEELCERSLWISTGHNWFFCEERTGDCVAYSLKEGGDSLLERSSCFGSS